MSLESLEMYQEFNNGENPLATGMEGMLLFTGLEAFNDEVKNLLDSSNPFFSQASLLFTYYRRKVANLHNEALNTTASIKLLRAFGVAGIGKNEKGEVDKGITKQIVKVHDDLVTNVEKTSSELPTSIAKFTVFIATMQRSIVELLKKSQEVKLADIAEEEKQEKVVGAHLKSKSSTIHTVIYASVGESQKAQIERRNKNSKKKNYLLSQLKTLFSFTEGIFASAQEGTHDMRLIPTVA